MARGDVPQALLHLELVCVHCNELVMFDDAEAAFSKPAEWMGWARGRASDHATACARSRRGEEDVPPPPSPARSSAVLETGYQMGRLLLELPKLLAHRGVIVSGGPGWSEFFDAAQRLYDLAVEMANRGDRFPVWTKADAEVGNAE